MSGMTAPTFIRSVAAISLVAYMLAAATARLAGDLLGWPWLGWTGRAMWLILLSPLLIALLICAFWEVTGRLRPGRLPKKKPRWPVVLRGETETASESESQS